MIRMSEKENIIEKMQFRYATNFHGQGWGLAGRSSAFLNISVVDFE